MVDLDLRKGRIGGSEVAAIFGDDDFGNDAFTVWYRKKGGGERPRPNTRQTMGHLLEPAILDLYTHFTGRVVQHHDRTILDPARPYMAATPDALCEGERRGVDAKLVFWDQRKLWGENANEIPHRVVFQCWWYMSAFDFPAWDVCAFIGTDEPRIYTIERDLETERSMLDYVERWHAKYIIGDEVPPMGRSVEAAAYLQALYPSHRRPDLREAEGDEIAMLDEYLHLLLENRMLKTRQAEIATALKAAIKDREGLEWSEGKFTWRKWKDSEEVDWQSMAIGLLYDAIKDDEGRAAHIKKFTRTIPGTRHVRMDHPLLRKANIRTEEGEEVTA